MDEEKKSGQTYEEWNKDELPEQNLLDNLINLFSGVSSSRWQGAHNDIDKLIANAPASSKIARISSEDFEGDGWKKDLYRVLDDKDSTIKLLLGQTVKGGNLAYSPEERTYMDILDQLKASPDGPGYNKADASWFLAQARANPYTPDQNPYMEYRPEDE